MLNREESINLILSHYKKILGAQRVMFDASYDCYTFYIDGPGYVYQSYNLFTREVEALLERAKIKLD